MALLGGGVFERGRFAGFLAGDNRGSLEED